MTNDIQQMEIVKAVKLFFANYLDFSGRASRGEFWWAYLAFFIVSIILAIVDAVIGGIIFGFTESEFLLNNGFFSNIFSLVTFIGFISLTSRRLQDTGVSGWYQLALYLSLMLPVGLSLSQSVATPFAIFIFIIVLITFIVFLAKPSIEEDNQWGNKPEHSTSNYSLGNNPKDW